MKPRMKWLAFPVIPVIGAVLFGLQCEKKAVDSDSMADFYSARQQNQIAAVNKAVTGQVKDAADGSKLIGADVTVVDTTRGLDRVLGTAKTDVNGQYEIWGVPEGTFLVFVSKSGYLDASVPAFIRGNYWSVELQTTYLRHVSSKALIGKAGGAVTDRDEEGDVIRLTVPADALDQDVLLSVTHLQGLEVPSYPPEHHLSVAAAYFGPAGTVFAKPVTLTFPLPQHMTTGTSLPLYVLDELQHTKWTDTGIQATVNPDGVSASAQVSHFSAYSLMPEIRVTETVEDTLWEAGERLLPDEGICYVSYKNQYDYRVPEYVHFTGDTAGLNTSTLIYMFEQLHGVPFTKPVTEALFFECPAGTYAYKVIRVLSLSEQMDLIQPDRSVTVLKRIKRPMIQFLRHDQGAGG
jgi:hypothetical protein